MTGEHQPRDIEENLARLLTSALGAQAQVDPVLRKRAFDDLLSELRARRAPAPFPDAVIALLGGVLACTAAALLLLVAWGRVPGIADPALLLLAVVVALNLSLVPVAGAVIVIGRQRD